jgi:hypothetical protein
MPIYMIYIYTAVLHNFNTCACVLCARPSFLQLMIVNGASALPFGEYTIWGNDACSP